MRLCCDSGFFFVTDTEISFNDSNYLNSQAAEENGGSKNVKTNKWSYKEAETIKD